MHAHASPASLSAMGDVDGGKARDGGVDRGAARDGRGCAAVTLEKATTGGCGDSVSFLFLALLLLIK